MSKSGNAIVFGAGNIGRGFLGSLLSNSGYKTTFIDVSENLIQMLNDEGRYQVHEVSIDGKKSHWVTGVSALHVADPGCISKIAEADIVLTAVGKCALKYIAKTLSEGIIERLKSKHLDEMHIVVLACENMQENTTYLKKKVFENIPEDMHLIIKDVVSFPDCVVDRIVPNSLGDEGHPLNVSVEEYYQLAIDKHGLLANMPYVDGITISENLQATLEQKLFTLNMGHALVAYFGFLKGFHFIHEAVQDSRIHELLTGALGEVERVLVKEFPSICPASQRAYAASVQKRFANPFLMDQVTRVARDPLRKLGGQDRLVFPAMKSIHAGIIPTFLCSGMAAAFGFNYKSDNEAFLLQEKLQNQGLGEVIESVTTIPIHCDLNHMIRSHYLLNV